ncbi:MAG: hemolysin family protein [Fimbriimonadaceae bacterium]
MAEINIAVVAGVSVALIVVNGLFVAAEFSTVGAPRPQIEQMATKGNGSARYLARLYTDPRMQDRYIATAQLGITLASLGLGMYAEHSFAEWLAPVFESFGWAQWLAAHVIASVFAIVLLTYLHIVLGEMIPKALALMSPARVATALVTPVRLTQFVFFPLIAALNGLGYAVLRLMRIERAYNKVESLVSTQELDIIIKESSELGQLDPTAAKVLQELFDFEELTASDVMVPRVKVDALRLGQSWPEILDFVRTHPHTRYLVYDGSIDVPVGALHVRDIVGHVEDDGVLNRSEVRPLPLVPGTSTLESVLAKMSDYRTQIAGVLDEQGGLAGIVTIEDLYDEVVGNLDDVAEIRKLPTGSVMASGTARVTDVCEQFGLDEEHEEVETVSGLVLMLLDRPPVLGDEVSWGGLVWRVISTEGNGVGECVVRLAATT